jgi:hypothetical protein
VLRSFQSRMRDMVSRADDERRFRLTAADEIVGDD